MFVHHVCKTSAFPGLELQKSMIGHVAVGVEPGSSERPASALYHWASSAAPRTLFLLSIVFVVVLFVRDNVSRSPG